MATCEVLNQIVVDLATAFPELVLWQTVYSTPTITWVPVLQQFELQIAEGHIQYGDFDGGIRREEFSIDVGILVRSTVDWQGRHAEVLRDEATSIHNLKERAIVSLEGTFLTDNLLTRPLRVTQESPVVSYKQNEIDAIAKIITFVGGLNVQRPR